ncbi:hypothetical protein ZIOFF_023134 [Zingiber officinale]|uniref:Reverse transcriptase Ty1/copia-type domain-containing protein n=1 Tax=Zingiber officinale TaxID=94328 RepID=A0A8J5HG46_ZINOF|nr:hypothetical protein ZIOFF_023134 [Zingiber officinale]
MVHNRIGAHFFYLNILFTNCTASRLHLFFSNGTKFQLEFYLPITAKLAQDPSYSLVTFQNFNEPNALIPFCTATTDPFLHILVFVLIATMAQRHLPLLAISLLATARAQRHLPLLFSSLRPVALLPGAFSSDEALSSFLPQRRFSCGQRSGSRESSGKALSSSLPQRRFTYGRCSGSREFTEEAGCSFFFSGEFPATSVGACFSGRSYINVSVPLLISLCGAGGCPTSNLPVRCRRLSLNVVQPFFTMADTGGSGLQIVSEKLSETNCASWAVAIELYVEGHDKLDILHGSKVKPDENDPSFRTWRRDNIQLMTWILNSVSSGIKQVILHNKTTYDMWKTLEQMYGRRHDMLCTYQLNSQIFKLEQGSMSVTNYFATLKGLWDEFDYYRMENWSSTDDHQRYLKLLEKDRIIKFLDGLNAEFENLKGQILGLDPTPSLEQVYYKILSEEGRRRTMNNKGISTVSPPIGETSVFIGSANKFRPGETKGRGGRFYQHCRRTNHDSDFCWEKYPEKKPEKFKHNAKKAPNSGNIAIQKLENEQTIGSSVPSTTGLSSIDIVNLQHLLSRLQASSSVSTPVQALTGIRGLGLSVTGPSFYSPWVINSGATDHMTNAANSFISYSLSSGQEKEIIVDGTKAIVAGKGSIKLTDHFFLSSALHDLETKQTIGAGREVGGLYYYQLETTSALKSAAKLVPHVVPSPIPLDVMENGKDAPSLGSQSSPDIITYKRRRHKQGPTIDWLVESDALAPDPMKQLSSSVEPTAPLNMNELNLPVAVRKGVRSCTQHPISNHVSYSRLSPSYHVFVSQLSNHAIPSSYYEVKEDRTTILLVYVDDMIVTGDDEVEIQALKSKLTSEFEIKDLGSLRYFLGIEVARSKKGIYVCQRKYVLDLLKETGKLGSRPASIPIEVNHDLTSSSGEDLTNLEKGTYQRLVGKLLYLSMTRPDITYAVNVVNQYMHAPKTIHMKVVDRILRYLKSCPGKGLLFKGGGDLKNKPLLGSEIVVVQNCNSKVIAHLMAATPKECLDSSISKLQTMYPST